jgi:alpha-D-ribose 1-methylphosphonate 5-triphosphate diphosphatase
MAGLRCSTMPLSLWCLPLPIPDWTRLLMSDLVLRQARLVTADAVYEGDLRVSGGRIADMSSGSGIRTGGEDLEGDLLLPGLVEIHTDHFERHLEPRPGVGWPPASAVLAHDAQVAAAGITTVLDAVCIGEIPGRDWRDIANAVMPSLKQLAAAGLLRAEHFLHLRCELPDPGLPDAFASHADDPLVRLVSVMDHTPGQRQFVDIDRYVRFQTGFGREESAVRATLAEGAERQALYAARHRQLLTDYCRNRGIPMASHDDETEEHVEEAQRQGVAISEFPTTALAAAAARHCGLLTVMGAPNVVRGGSHSGNVSALDLARQGLLDILSSDYMPASLLLAAFRLAEPAETGGGLSLPAAIACISRTPARAVGLMDRGEIAIGQRADLIQVRPTPFGPVVRAVWRAGQRVA